MTLMAWSPYFETGLDLVDSQHHALVDMVNSIAPHLALNDDVAKRAVGPLLDNLTHYAAVHFRDEERLMVQRSLTLEYQVHHHQSHQAFVDELVQMRRQYELEGTLSGTDLLRFLGSWLSFHILVEDQRMAHQMTYMAQGQTAQEAYEHVSQPQDAAHAVYSSSLLDLFTLLTERNRKLALANEEVHRVKAALELANQSLELRVEERTRDLATSMASLEQAQSQLLQSEKMAAVGQLAAGVAHEINNPIGFVTSNLGSMAAYVDQLFELLEVYGKAAQALAPEQQARIEAVRKKIDLDYLREDIPTLLNESAAGLARVKRIVDDLREFSRSDEEHWVWSDLNQTLEHALKVAGNEIRKKADVVKDLGVLPPVECIASQLTQVMVNLLVNAAQAIAGKGRITVRTGVLPGDQVWLEISDSGCGMSSEVKNRAFEPFFTTKPVGSGTGLGLSISWEIIKRHHGHMDIQSEPGQGATFRITLPQKHVIPSPENVLQLPTKESTHV
jgi:hemerythrin-like metal-binding protein